MFILHHKSMFCIVLVKQYSLVLTSGETFK